MPMSRHRPAPSSSIDSFVRVLDALCFNSHLLKAAGFSGLGFSGSCALSAQLGVGGGFGRRREGPCVGGALLIIGPQSNATLLTLQAALNHELLQLALGTEL